MMIEQRTLKKAGIYVIIILALIRFLVYPLQASIGEKKITINDLYQKYQIKREHFERQEQKQNKQTKFLMDEKYVVPHLYEKGMPFSSIQANLIDIITKDASMQGLIVQNFEMLEPTVGKIISEVPVLIRLAGRPDKMIDALTGVTAQKKALHVKTLEMGKNGPELWLVLTIIAYRVEK